MNPNTRKQGHDTHPWVEELFKEVPTLGPAYTPTHDNWQVERERLHKLLSTADPSRIGNATGLRYIKLMAWCIIFEMQIDGVPHEFVLTQDGAIINESEVWGHIGDFPCMATSYVRREIARKILKGDGMKLEGLSPEDKWDKGLVTTAVRQNPKALQFASNKLQNDPDIIELANDPLTKPDDSD